MKIIQIGAEAVLIRKKDKLIKNRIPKLYRLKEIDYKIRKSRTRREAKLLSRLNFVPRLFNFDDQKAEIEMEFIDGKLLRDILNNMYSKKRKEICKLIGRQIYEMHQKGIIHGDLTTSNMILRNNKIYFIDFGLGFFSNRIEDKATDIKLLRQALESKHHTCFNRVYKEILKEYKDKKVLEWLKDKVEKRGRYKGKKYAI